MLFGSVGVSEPLNENESGRLLRVCRRVAVACLVWGLLGLLIGSFSALGGNSQGAFLGAASIALAGSAILFLKAASPVAMIVLGSGVVAMDLGVVFAFVADSLRGDSWGLPGVLGLLLISGGAVWCFALAGRLRRAQRLA
jgi:hypothetical protein